MFFYGRSKQVSLYICVRSDLLCMFQILPSLVEMLKEFPGYNLKLCLPCLQFTYWSLVHVEQSQGQQVGGVGC